MKRIIMHWTAGSHRASSTDLKHYHFVVEADGAIVAGNYPVSANESTSTPYAAHTRGTNTGSIGVAVAAMHGAKERPFSSGQYPITQVQINALAELVADLAADYDIPVERTTILTHAEVQPTLGIKQAGKWDIMWVPGMTAPGDPVVVGDKIRKMVRDYTKSSNPPETGSGEQPAPPAGPHEEVPPVSTPAQSFWARVWAFLTGGKV